MRGLDFILEHHRGELGDSLQYSTLLYKVWRGRSSSLTLLLLLRMTYTMLSGTERKERAVPDQSSQSSTIHVQDCSPAHFLIRLPIAVYSIRNLCENRTEHGWMDGSTSPPLPP